MAKEFSAQWVILYSAIIIWINVFASHDRGGEEGGNIWNCHGAYIEKKILRRLSRNYACVNGTIIANKGQADESIFPYCSHGLF